MISFPIPSPSTIYDITEDPICDKARKVRYSVYSCIKLLWLIIKVQASLAVQLVSGDAISQWPTFLIQAEYRQGYTTSSKHFTCALADTLMILLSVQHLRR